jgi:hypothetical protein
VTAVKILVPALVALAVCAPAAASHREAPCTGSALAASFSVVRGSAGAGNIVYALRLRNRGRSACFVSGLPQLRLLDRRGHLLPTKVAAAFPGALTAVRVGLVPGGWASASARFSPDVPGPGEGHPGKPCEPVAYRVRVHAPPGSGWTTGPVTPPTSVCEHGRLSMSALVAGKTPPHA